MDCLLRPSVPTWISLRGHLWSDSYSPGLKTLASGRLNHQRSISTTAVFSTTYWTSPMGTACSGTQRLVLPGKVLLLIRFCKPHVPPRRISGLPTTSRKSTRCFLIGVKKYGFEIKLNDVPKITASMWSTLTDLELEHLWVIYPGKRVYPAAEKISVWPITHIDRLPYSTRNS